MTKNVFQRLLIGFKKGITTPTLPQHILKLHNNVFIRILRVLGGVSLLLILTKKIELLGSGYLYLTVLWVCFIISFIFSIYLLYINYYRIIHLYKLIKSDELKNKQNNNKKSSKNINWWKLIKISIFICFIINLVLKYIFNIEDNNNFILITIYSIYYYITYYTKYIIWGIFISFLVIYLYMLFKYLKFRYFYEIEFKKVSKYWPKFIKEEINDFNEISQIPELKKILIKTNFKNIIIYNIIFIFYLCLILYL